MSYTTLKEQKESFVTGHSGTSSAEILLVCSAIPIGVFVVLALYRSLQSFGMPALACNWKVQAFVEWMCLLLPMTLCQTRLIDNDAARLVLVLLAGSVISFLLYFVTTNTQKSMMVSEECCLQFCRNLFTIYRSAIAYMTFIAILAVDFNVFPRRFAKTETSGCGLMDLGAASYVLSGAMCSKYARSGQYTYQSFWTSMKKSLPIIILGCIRFLTTKGIEYQEHASEYGIHWNFYFTLASISIIIPSISYRNRKLVCSLFFVVTAIYQLSLSNGLQEVIESYPRVIDNIDNDYMIYSIIVNVFAANREGIFGCIGYAALYVTGEEISAYCIWSPVKARFRNSKKNDDNMLMLEKSQSRLLEKSMGVRLQSTTVILWALYYIVTQLLSISVSRRSTNTSFIVWCLAVNVSILLSIYFVMVRFEAPTKMPFPIFLAVNRNGLVMFLLANLLTGAVNLTINTLNTHDCAAAFIIFAYLLAIGIIALIFDKCLNITFKL